MNPNEQPSVPAPPPLQPPLPPDPAVRSDMPPSPGRPSTPQQPITPQGMPAFMYPNSTMPEAPISSSKKSKKLLIILIAVIVLFAAGGAAALLLTQKDSSAPTANTNDTQNQINQNQPAAASTDVYGLSTDLMLQAAPTFNISEDLSGWQTDPNAPSGSTGYMHSGGCKVVYTQGGTQRSNKTNDATATDEVLNTGLEALKATGTVSDIVYGTETIAVKDSDKRLEFKTVSFTYATDVTEHRSIITARQANGYVIGARFYCPTPAFSDTLHKQVIDSLTINMSVKES